MVAVAQNLTATPVGSIVMWATSTPPIGWLICNGSVFSGATYPELAVVLGGTTLPNLTDRFPYGVGAEAVGVTGGVATHTHTQPTHIHTQPTHTHNGTSHDHTITHTHQVDPPNTTSGGPSATVASGLLGLLVSAASTAHTHDTNIAAFASGGSSAANTGTGGAGATSASGGDNTGASGGDNTGSSSNVPPYLRLNFIIKTI